MNVEEKVKEAFRIIHSEYGSFLSPETIGVYYSLLYIGDGSENITLEEMLNGINLDSKEIKSHLRVLKTCDLIVISDLTGKKAIRVSPPVRLAYEYKVSLVEKLVDSGIINKAKLSDILSKIKIQNEELVKRERGDSDFAFDEAKILSPETPEGLLNFYYKFLSKEFGGTYRSHNEMTETSKIEDSMIKNGDTPEIMRKMFTFLISDARKRNDFNQVSSLKFFGNMRNNAHRVVTTSGEASDGRFAKSVADTPEDMDRNMRDVYAIYTKKDGMAHQDAIEKMKKAFGSELLRGLGGEEKDEK